MNNNNFLNNGRVAVLLILTIGTLMITAPALAQQNSKPREQYTINPGDILEVSVWKELDLQRQVLGHWLQVELEGSGGNRDAVGAVVTARAGDLTDPCRESLTGGDAMMTTFEQRQRKRSARASP